MDPQTLQDLIGLLMAVVFLGLGFLVVWLVRSRLKIEGDALIIALLILPVLVYVVFSGRLQEFRGPGGFELKLVEVAGKSIEASSETIEAFMEEAPVEDTQFVDRGGTEQVDSYRLKQLLEGVDKSKPVVMKFVVGIEDRYKRPLVLKYLNELTRYRNFKYVILVDQSDRLVGYLPADLLQQILETEQTGRRFITMVNEGRLPALTDYPGMVTIAISSTATNTQALRKMTDQDLPALVVTDDEHTPLGVIERDQLLSKLLLAVTGE